MKRQFVQMTGQGAKAYYLAQKTERKQAAEHYRDHPEMLLSQVAALFKLPMSSMRKGLAENGIETDRSRQYGRKQHRLTCPECRQVVFHACKEHGEARREQAMKSEYIDPRRIHPITGRIMERTPDFIAYMESNPLPAAADEEGNPVDYFPDDTPEQRELAELGFDGLMQRARRELGLE